MPPATFSGPFLRQGGNVAVQLRTARGYQSHPLLNVCGLDGAIPFLPSPRLRKSFINVLLMVLSSLNPPQGQGRSTRPTGTFPVGSSGVIGRVRKLRCSKRVRCSACLLIPGRVRVVHSKHGLRHSNANRRNLRLPAPGNEEQTAPGHRPRHPRDVEGKQDGIPPNL